MDNLNVKKFFPGPKIIFLILGLILLAEVIFAVRIFITPLPSPPPDGRAGAPVVKQTVLSGGKISLKAPKASFGAKEAVPVSVIINTGEHIINGADVIVRFDPKILEATSGGLIKGTIFDEYPAMSVDNAKGLISVSGISSLQSGFKGQGQFALINLRVRALGKTTLTVEFTKGSTADSNLVETSTSKDILEAVDNLEVEVK